MGINIKNTRFESYREIRAIFVLLLLCVIAEIKKATRKLPEIIKIDLEFKLFYAWPCPLNQ